jgi:dTMP kinase
MAAKTIAIEGSDASGKETQSHLLREHLIKDGFRAAVMSFPRYNTPTGLKITEYLTGKFGNPVEMDPLKSARFYYEDRKAALPEIKKLSEENDFIIFDRYKGSNLGFHGAKGKTPNASAKIIELIERMEHDIPEPDINIFLFVSADISDKLRPVKDDEHEKNIDFQRRVGKMFEWLCENRGWKKILCVDEKSIIMSREAIHKKVYGEVKKFFHLG